VSKESEAELSVFAHVEIRIEPADRRKQGPLEAEAAGQKPWGHGIGLPSTVGRRYEAPHPPIRIDDYGTADSHVDGRSFQDTGESFQPVG
jgi:hypothetical protein